MSSKNSQRLHSVSNARDLEFSFAPNGSSAIDATLSKGAIKDVSVAYTTTGTYTLTIKGSVTQLLNFQVMCDIVGESSDFVMQGGAFVAATTGVDATKVIRAKTGTTNTDIAADAVNRVYVKLTVR